MSKVLITTVPFADYDSNPLKLLERAGINFLINPIGRKLKEEELINMVSDFDAIIAGTELITANVLNCARNLRLISRVGVGLDSVDLITAKKLGIKVCYTPNAPAPAVSELTICLMLTLLRHVHVANSRMHQGEWHRFFGKRISEVTIGIIGAGRIGRGVIERLQSFGPSEILVNDINQSLINLSHLNIKAVSKDYIYRHADLISIHVPLTNQTKDMIGYEQLKQMKHDALIVNTARGGIINESALSFFLKNGHLAGAAVDVFENEPYFGELQGIDRCLLTSHMGSMSIDCRAKMETEATEEVIRFLSGIPLKNPVPIEEYDIQLQEFK